MILSKTNEQRSQNVTLYEWFSCSQFSFASHGETEKIKIERKWKWEMRNERWEWKMKMKSAHECDTGATATGAAASAIANRETTVKIVIQPGASSETAAEAVAAAPAVNSIFICTFHSILIFHFAFLAFTCHFDFNFLIYFCYSCHQNLDLLSTRMRS